MKKIVISLLLLTLSFRLSAQIDYLEPVKPFTTYTGELGEYYRNVFSLLNTGFQQRIIFDEIKESSFLFSCNGLTSDRIIYHHSCQLKFKWVLS